MSNARLENRLDRLERTAYHAATTAERARRQVAADFDGFRSATDGAARRDHFALAAVHAGSALNAATTAEQAADELSMFATFGQKPDHLERANRARGHATAARADATAAAEVIAAAISLEE